MRKDDGITNQVDKNSVIYAHKHAAESIGKLRLPDGTLIDDPTSQWFISEKARKKIHDALVLCVEGKIDQRQVIENVLKVTSLDKNKAKILVNYEIAAINSMASFNSYREAHNIGVKIKKAWLVGQTPCSGCKANANAGAINLEDNFPSGDLVPPAHMECCCTITPVVVP